MRRKKKTTNHCETIYRARTPLFEPTIKKKATVGERRIGKGVIIKIFFQRLIVEC